MTKSKRRLRRTVLRPLNLSQLENQQIGITLRTLIARAPPLA
ncbi:hypothetical protein OESDEN_14790 [Oesophagostomum dentatum]|uniref:Uncharacterized protein n=1 Tax=Oesophagostomum dentatum TaxID=61180 RepID=A0A0B1SJG7_OESDE|nr:hypothetical protein OESDEN_14790 [Oesophagostomum dentatum]